MLIMLFKILLSFWMTTIKQLMQTSMQTQSHAVLSFEVKSKTSLVKLRHQIKRDKAFCFPCCHSYLTAASSRGGKLNPLVTQTARHIHLNTFPGC